LVFDESLPQPKQISIVNATNNNLYISGLQLQNNRKHSAIMVDVFIKIFNRILKQHF